MIIMVRVFNARIILQNSIYDWQKKLEESNSKEVLMMIKRKVTQIERMDKCKDYKIKW